jgi:hypothetical protein
LSGICVNFSSQVFPHFTYFLRIFLMIRFFSFIFSPPSPKGHIKEEVAFFVCQELKSRHFINHNKISNSSKIILYNRKMLGMMNDGGYGGEDADLFYAAARRKHSGRDGPAMEQLRRIFGSRPNPKMAKAIAFLPCNFYSPSTYGT